MTGELPLALALVAGAVAAFNPCGFALLPAYLALLVADGATGGRSVALLRAGRFAGGMTLGFVAVFGLFGAVIAPIAVSVERYLPVVTVVLGVVLLALGVRVLRGGSLALPWLYRNGRGPTGAWWSQVIYGVSFALASLSCTVAPFLAVISTALRVGEILGVVATFVAYGVGMGIVVLLLAVGAAVAGTSYTRSLRRASPVLSRVSGLLLLAAGIYVMWYGGYELRVLAGATSDDPVVEAVTGLQAHLARSVAAFDPRVLLVVGAALVAGVALVAWGVRGGAGGANEVEPQREERVAP